MAIADQKITDKYAVYNGDCLEVLPTLPADSIHLSVYSPPFCGLYQYSSTPRDMSNCRSYDEFFVHYGFLVEQLARVTMPGRCSAVHCMDVPTPGKSGANVGSGLKDFPGDIIRLHEAHGWQYAARYSIWKEPLGVRNRTMAKGLAHKQIVDDSSLCDVASADYLLLFRKRALIPYQLHIRPAYIVTPAVAKFRTNCKSIKDGPASKPAIDTVIGFGDNMLVHSGMMYALSAFYRIRKAATKTTSGMCIRCSWT